MYVFECRLKVVVPNTKLETFTQNLYYNLLTEIKIFSQAFLKSNTLNNCRCMKDKPKNTEQRCHFLQKQLKTFEDFLSQDITPIFYFYFDVLLQKLKPINFTGSCEF